ncbi:5-formyltetrahydrofolate cyclo-ligase [Herbaspirillum sp. RTI4]|uniref:5-formyltetrahydrofolate cyclo-ligase n=1 Tax=Herbaspirillum sp. RTI4 TaxID=3048640 RepID=UPI002AB3324C|nr:5-formyltetrahydrofolate cyclo-ligase [Herbaspirillum sp. RTI4]MDY7576919.1 5-formyltetrahydrofolate cyclo-ligase [Herbaspirillum sp. RTI4]MEA9983210.1 5-formyltetrahydrofolate cyclo-ligase [Herbaspirillum sp. RTI4]
MTTPRIAREGSDPATVGTSDVVQQKSLVRAALLAHRRALGAEEKAEAAESIGTQLLEWLETHPTALLGVYWPIRGEPDLRHTYELFASRGIALALPVVIANDLPLEFRRWQPGDALLKDSFGVPVPAHTALVMPTTLLIPCVGFNAARIRMGYGGGFYDRTLAQPQAPESIGVAYVDTLADFQGEAHDVALDRILTETGWY